MLQPPEIPCAMKNGPSLYAKTGAAGGAGGGRIESLISKARRRKIGSGSVHFATDRNATATTVATVA